MRARQYNHNSGKRRGKNPLSAPEELWIERPHVAPSKLARSDAFDKAPRGHYLRRRDVHLPLNTVTAHSPAPELLRGMNAGKREQRQSRNDTRLYGWSSQGQQRPALAGIDNGPKQPRSF